MIWSKWIRGSKACCLSPSLILRLFFMDKLIGTSWSPEGIALTTFTFQSGLRKGAASCESVLWQERQSLIIVAVRTCVTAAVFRLRGLHLAGRPYKGVFVKVSFQLVIIIRLKYWKTELNYKNDCRNEICWSSLSKYMICLLNLMFLSLVFIEIKLNWKDGYELASTPLPQAANASRAPPTVSR